MSRLLSSSELYDGIHVKVNSHKGGHDIDNQIYNILIQDEVMWYTIPGADWKMPGHLVKNNWIEDDETIQLNRESKLNKIL